ncbi:MAPEG family protein [Maricaulis sp. CAU 1757]
MTVELWMLFLGVVVLFVAIVVQATIGVFKYGLVRQAGPRDDPYTPDILHGRTNRAVINQVESLAMFAPVVLIVHLVGGQTEMTMVGAQLYGVCRVLYLPAYWLGLPWVRTLLFAGGLVGTVMVAWPLIGLL